MAVLSVLATIGAISFEVLLALIFIDFSTVVETILAIFALPIVSMDLYIACIKVCLADMECMEPPKKDMLETIVTVNKFSCFVLNREVVLFYSW